MIKKKNSKISSGSYDLNTWLYGGYEKDVITMIAGPAGSGKTNFSVLASCSQARKGNKVIFMDTEGGFSVERVKQIVGETYEDILKNILLLEPVSFDEQKKSFTNLLNHLNKDQIGLIVIDGMAMLYRLELGDAVKSKDDSRVKQVNREVAKQMRVLSEIARKKNIPVIITNQVYEGFVCEEDWRKGIRGEINIVGGDLFKYWSKCILELKHDRGKRKCVLLKHRSLATKEMNFDIRNKGIFKRGWI
jgi:DNA repair protein RadB